jgi:SulP family sulfate permease
MLNWRSALREISGAFADLGTFLPIVIGVLSLRQMDPTGLLVGFGLFSLAVAIIYRRPIPVQPMKAVAAIVITSQVGPSEIAATGLLIGLLVLLFGLTRWINRVAEKLPQTLLQGIQMGIGLYLVWAALKLMMPQWTVAIPLFTLLMLLHYTHLKGYSVLLIIAALSVWALCSGTPLPEVKIGLYWPHLVTPHWQDLWHAASGVLFPQLALTLTNAVVVTAAIAGDLFPNERSRITPQRLALSSGGLNLLLAPFGAFPMCHGAGGLVVQHRFGARTGWAPAIFGICCLSMGLFLGPDALKLLQLLPVSAVGVLLAIAGVHLALNRKLMNQGRWSLAVILTTALGSVVFNVAIGFFIGLIAEFLRVRYIDVDK